MYMYDDTIYSMIPSTISPLLRRKLVLRNRRKKCWTIVLCLCIATSYHLTTQGAEHIVEAESSKESFSVTGGSGGNDTDTIRETKGKDQPQSHRMILSSRQITTGSWSLFIFQKQEALPLRKPAPKLQSFGVPVILRIIWQGGRWVVLPQI
jgi:hypothetical protein